ncbi:histidine triad (HIT) family protein [Propionicimonas paludicola]|uniref:Histidine triad (HIT) family protein n=1 Tax=Propionicimonas paludicola TaxID=185243 RepID=A0A2A9CSC5_9ACTN|nr:HIT domain-containing protein [Propionicimonas paludicola]PFG16530.1 histidine triad (HIT) family protein [Propionicimonas paludicola]
MDCLFCAIIAGDIPSRQVYADDTAVAFLDINPWHRGHTLVIPRQHVADALADPETLSVIAPAVQATGRLLVDRLGADGLNLLVNSGAVAGQEVFHLHVHLIPRYAAKPGMSGLMERDPAHDLDEVQRQILGR